MGFLLSGEKSVEKDLVLSVIVNNAVGNWNSRYVVKTFRI